MFPTEQVPTRYNFPAIQHLPAGQVLGFITGSGVLPEEKNHAIKKDFSSLVRYQIARSTMGESSSVPVETAEEILESTLFTLGVALKRYPTPRKSLSALCDHEMGLLLKEGQQCIEKDIATAKRLWRAVKSTALATPNGYYNDTLQGGIAVFFQKYDLYYFSARTPAMIDYPLSIEIEGYEGIEYIQKYLRGLFAENLFLRHFDPMDIHRLLLRNIPEYFDLFINLFEPVLLCSLGCLFSQTNPQWLAPNPSALAHLEKTSNIQKLFAQSIENLCGEFGIRKEDPLREYLAHAAGQALPRLLASSDTSSFFYCNQVKG